MYTCRIPNPDIPRAGYNGTGWGTAERHWARPGWAERSETRRGTGRGRASQRGGGAERRVLGTTSRVRLPERKTTVLDVPAVDDKRIKENGEWLTSG